MIYSPEEYSFLRAIAEEPDNDLPRLIYADWLEDQGNPRGEFIRILCELARIPPADLERDELLQREDELRRQWRRSWAEPFFQAGVNELWFHRGVVDTVEATIDVFLDRLPVFADLALVVRVIRLYSPGNSFSKLLEADLSALTSIRLELPGTQRDELADLLTAETLSNLTSLQLQGGDWSNNSGPTGRPGLPSLERLGVVGQTALSAIRRIDFPKLRELIVMGVPFEESLADRLCRHSPAALRATQVRLIDCTIPPAAAAILNSTLGSRLIVQHS